MPHQTVPHQTVPHDAVPALLTGHAMLDHGGALMDPGGATYHEITHQTAAWAEALTVVIGQRTALTELWAASAYEQVLFTGCGSTYYLATAAAALWNTLIDVPARAAPAGELYLYPPATYGPGAGRRTLLVAVSRSGTTSETVAATRQFKARGLGQVIVVTNYGATPLAALGDITIDLPAGQEESVAQTRSFAAMYVATTALTATLAGATSLLDEMAGLPAVGERLLASCAPLARLTGADLTSDRFYFLGSGPRYGLACEVNLKMKEMTLTHSEPFHFFEFRHGPMSMVNDRAVVVGLVGDARRDEELQVLREMAALGGKTLALGETACDITFASGLSQPARNVLYLPVLQLLAYYRAIAKGLNPDRPANLTAVIKLALPEAV